jgi:DNA-binding transcriptional regulator YiaG
MEPCLKCQRGPISDAPGVPFSLKVGEHAFSGQLPGSVCGACGAMSYSLEGLVAFERAAAAALVEAGEAGPAAFTFLRRWLDLRAPELAPLLGIEATEISRWERGEAPVPRMAAALLLGLARDELAGRAELMKTLQVLQAPRPLPAALELEE